MMISLHMIAHAMHRFSPEFIGEPSGRIFDRIHIQADNAPADGPCALAIAEPSNDGREKNRIVLCAGEGRLVFSGFPVEEVLNALQDALAYYQNLEMRLAAALLDDHPEQAALSAVQELIGPSFIYSNDFKLLAVSRNYDDVPVNAFWDKYVVGRNSDSFSSLFDGWSLMGMTLERHDMEVFVEPNGAPYQYGIFNSYLNKSGQIIGFLVVSGKTELGQFDYDITSVLVEALNAIQLHKPAGLEYRPPWFSDEALAERLLLHGDQETAYMLNKKHSTDGKSFIVAAARIPGEHLRAAFCMEASALIGSCISFSHDDSLLFLVWGNQDIEDSLVRRISPYAEHVNARMGISNRFEDASKANLFAPQAFYALEQNRASLVRRFFPEALSYLIHCQDEKLQFAARHPAVFQLEQLSILRNTDYLATMREYLMCDRSVKRTAERLFLHRNTIIYRIDQARQSAEFDLEDDYERHYLLYSLLV